MDWNPASTLDLQNIVTAHNVTRGLGVQVWALAA